MPELDAGKLIVIDESGFNLSMLNVYGRALSGKRVKVPTPMRSKNISVVGAIGLRGIVEVGMIEGSFNSISFEIFLKDILLEKLKKGDILLLDNAPIHNVERIRKIVSLAGAKVLTLPPYSPDFSPIELLWSKAKCFTRKIAPRTIGSLYETLQQCFEVVDDEDIIGWFEHCGYEVQPI